MNSLLNLIKTTKKAGAKQHLYKRSISQILMEAADIRILVFLNIRKLTFWNNLREPEYVCLLRFDLFKLFILLVKTISKVSGVFESLTKNLR